MAFIGLRVPEGSAQALARFCRGGEREAVADYHITLVYLGDELSAETLWSCRKALQRVAETTTVFDVTANRLTTFPPHPRHGTVPSIVAIEGEELHELRARVVAALEEEGVEVDQTFPVYQPHVTLSYFPNAREGAAAPVGPLVPGEYWSVEEMHLWGADEGMEDKVTVFPLKTAMTARLMARQTLADADVTWDQVAALGQIPGPIGDAIQKLGLEWAGSDPERITAAEPRIGTLWMYREDGGLHIDFTPRHSQSVTGSLAERIVARTLLAEDDVPRLVARFREAATDFLTFRKEISEAFELGLEYGTIRAMPEEEGKKVSKAFGNVTYSKPHLLVAVVNQGRVVFPAVLSALAMPDPLRKKAEAAARVWATRPMRPKSDMLVALEWYDKKATVVEAHLALLDAILASGKAHSEGEGDGAGTKIKAGPFTLINTGGFKPDVMAKMVDIVSKATTLLQQSGFGSIAYGDIQITNSLMRSNVLAFYNLKDDKLYIRANVKAGWDTLQTVLHELGHRWENKKLKSGVANALYRAVAGEEHRRDVKLPPPPIGDILVQKGKTYTVEKVQGQTVLLRLEGKGTATTSIESYYGMKGIGRRDQAQMDPNYKGFVTNYAKTDAAENFAEMFSLYCMGDLPVAQSGLFEDLVLGDGKLASHMARRLLARSLFNLPSSA